MLLINKIKKQLLPERLKINKRLNKKQQSYLLSAVFAVMLIVHLLMSDLVIAGKTFAEPQEVKEKVEIYIPRVQVEIIEPESIEKPLKLYGRTAPNRVASIKSQIETLVDALPIKEGQHLKAGQVLIQLDQQAIEQQLNSAKTQVKYLTLESEAAQRLIKKGHLSKVQAEAASANLAHAKTDLKSFEIWEDNLKITAPFDGVLNRVYVELGDYVQKGTQLAEVVDLDPLVININIPETSIHTVKKGQKARVKLLEGSEVGGEIRYIASVSNQGTNMFLAEVVIPNADGKISAGISVSVDLLTEKILGSQVSPAYLTLNDEGQSGIYVVEGDKAIFKPVDMLASTPEKLWVTSLGENAQVIISGHQSVIDGSPVKVIDAVDNKVIDIKE
jgi:multidrug efflux system membrane fusion protein